MDDILTILHDLVSQLGQGGYTDRLGHDVRQLAPYKAARDLLEREGLDPDEVRPWRDAPTIMSRRHPPKRTLPPATP